MVPDMEDISAGHSPAGIPSMTVAAVSTGTPHLLIQPPQQLMQPFNQWMPHCHSHCDTNWHSGIPTCTCHFFHRCYSCHFMDQSQSSSSNLHCTAQETQPRKAKLHPKHSTPINPSILRLSPSRIPLLILHQIETVTPIL